MNFEEKQILDFLKPHPLVFFSVHEIAKKAGLRRQFQQNPDWPVYFNKPTRIRHRDSIFSAPSECSR